MHRAGREGRKFMDRGTADRSRTTNHQNTCVPNDLCNLIPAALNVLLKKTEIPPCSDVGLILLHVETPAVVTGVIW